jgi:hypothetical protein
MSGLARRSNGSIVGSPIISISTNPSSASGMWDKNDHYTLSGASLWPKYAGASMVYDFISNNTSATFYNVYISGLVGGNASGSSYGSGGSFIVSDLDKKTSLINGVDGGNGGSGVNNITGSSGGGIGGTAGSSGQGPGGTGQNISGLFTAVSGAGTSLSNFGSGGVEAQNGNFAGGGGGGAGFLSGYVGGTGGNGAIVWEYRISGTSYYGLRNQSAGAGSFTFPDGTSYVKIWCIGKGGSGALTTGSYKAGGGAGGVAYAVFS